jgi:hypothetical protein
MNTKRGLTTLTKNEAENVLAWLNDELPRNSYPRAGRRRIVELIGTTKRLLDLTNEAGRQGLGIRRWPKELVRCAAWVNERILQYPACPIVMWSPQGTLTFGEDFSFRPRFEDEAATAHCILGLARANVLDHVRQCACKRWFFARSKNQRSCSATCRHRLYERTDAFKAMRRLYMKQYSRLKRSGKVK